MTNNNNEVVIDWNFDNSYEKLPSLFFSKVEPNEVESPSLVVLNEDLAEKLGLNANVLKSEEGIQILAGNALPNKGSGIAQAYAGHQFGNFTMLGDGRALMIGEQITPRGERFDLQLKGSGRTPYSRGGDGRAALGPMLREYIISEAMHGFGIPTTRSLAVVSTGEKIIRERVLPGAILTRVASSHLRFGTFEYVANWGDMEKLRALADYAMERHYPTLDRGDYLGFFRSVMKRHATLIAKWQLVGFIHGVMNTDNMTISGETIDYGPCAFMDTYNPDTVFSSIDAQGRYAYKNQPRIGGWNLARFAESLLPLFHKEQKQAVELAQEELYKFEELFKNQWLTGMRAKLGLFREEEADGALAEGLLNVMLQEKADFTNTFRGLTLGNLEETGLVGKPSFEEWDKLWQARLSRQGEGEQEVRELMRKNNPAIIPRNHRVETALEAAVEHGNYRVMENLVKVLRNPFAYSLEQGDYCVAPGVEALGYRTYCGT
ncbi:protein adenylyltransferase SelO [Sutcliffiella rhizosphaerae]|uniref:Protein nucleotidyltransferase YdiU n=1 Tax=Sutcliffiella rhizosphaerae TaxID=2880967 RepID=A0ABM8YK11_9BACI|nr:YdiU family protein [Sutcliffiella rhizosphaerae]CAG9620252.1 Protein adenylyltransferase SelO [Sutcliffiella rhizosphaerae]